MWGSLPIHSPFPTPITILIGKQQLNQCPLSMH
uniref:Uncharacterized protein n=1 Tax=Anguilla anguilla TaxID=7936 RepID=A0A0E9UM60_ANGAN